MFYVNEKLQNDIIKKVENKYGEEIAKSFANKAASSMHWAYKLIAFINIIGESAVNAIGYSNPNDITIYNRINTHPQYLTIFEGYNSNISMTDIIKDFNVD